MDTDHRFVDFIIDEYAQNRRTVLIVDEVRRFNKSQQDAFLRHGVVRLRPLNLRAVDDAIGVHESTVSRATANKYMATPRGLFELKYFFSSHVSTSDGGAASSTAIRAVIKKLIAAENPTKPLSDNKIAQLLEEQGIKVARRTIAKYRESLGIPPSNQRKQLL